jgi:hydrogenase small subunit
MTKKEPLMEYLSKRGVSRRSFLKFCAVTSSALALPAGAAKVMANALAAAPRPSVIWLSFQECTGCTESLTRAYEPTVESLILDQLSLDYHHTLQAAAGEAAEKSRLDAMQQNYGSYVLVVDGAIPTADGGAWSTIAGMTNVQMLRETVEGAAVVIAVGTCAAFGGLPAAAAVYQASPNQSGASGVADLMSQGQVAQQPLVNVPGCPPVPEVITGVVAHYLTFGTLPELDQHQRPLAFFGSSVHDACPRRGNFSAGYFAKAFDDDAARNGACLFELGCRGPETHNACPQQRWNGGTSFPVHSGHGCLGCSEPDFWDKGMRVASVSSASTAFAGSSFYPDVRPE